MDITPLYASLLALLFLALSVRTLRLRKSLKIAIGDAGNPVLLRAMRVHSNFAEYVPLCLFLVFLVEINEANALIVHGLGSCLLLGRLSHAFGVSQARENYVFRVFGMVMTFAVLVGASAFLLVCYAGKVAA